MLTALRLQDRANAVPPRLDHHLRASDMLPDFSDFADTVHWSSARDCRVLTIADRARGDVACVEMRVLRQLEGRPGPARHLIYTQISAWNHLSAPRSTCMRLKES